MEILALFGAFLWLAWESSKRSRTDADLEDTLLRLRQEVAELRRAAQPRPQAEPTPVPGPTPAPVPTPVPAPGPPRSKAPWAQDTAPVPVPPPAPRREGPRPEPAPPMPRPPVPAPAPLPAPEPRQPFDWESLVGVKLFSYIAGVALLVAAVAFLKYSLENGWLSHPVQMTIGLLTGMGLLAACETKRARVYGVTAHALTAAGIAILFSTFYASTALWHLLPAAAAFLLMALVTAVAVVLSFRRDSVFIALLGLLGGFLTPLLLSTGEDRPFGLFGYLALLNVGLGWVAYRKRWPVLTALTLAFTTFYQLAWVLRFLGEAKLGIALGVFLLFPILAFGALFLARDRGDEAPPRFRTTAALSAIPPVLFALSMAMNPVYGHHYGLMFGFLFLVAAGLAAVALLRGPEWLHALGAGAVLALFGVWLACSYTSEAWPFIVGFTALFAALFLVIPVIQTRLRHKRPFLEAGRVAVYAAPLLMFTFPALVVLEPAAASPLALFPGLLLLLAMASAYAVRFGEGRVYVIAALATLLTETFWSSHCLDSSRLLAALLVYGGFGLFFLAVPYLAERRGRAFSPEGTGSMLLLVSLGLLLFLATGRIAGHSLGVLAALLLILNGGLLFEASRGRRVWLAILGLGVSFLVLAAWWSNAPLALLLLPALGVILAFTLLVAGGTVLLQARLSGPGRGAEGLLGLTGLLFLVHVAGRPELASPPWPFLAVLAVLGLALGVAALRLRSGAVLVGCALLTQVVLVAWVQGSGSTSLAPSLAPWAALAFAGLGLVWFELGRDRDDLFSLAAGLGFLGAQLVLVLVKQEAAPGLMPGNLVLVHGALAAGLLLLARRSHKQAWALVLAVSTGLVLLVWHGPELAAGGGAGLLWVAAPLYLLQLAYPLLLGEEALDAGLPWFSAVLASGVFFFAARPALQDLGCGSVIGALPVVQAVLLVPHLLRMRGFAARSQAALGRLALVAGAILAFVTVAIPLQLDNEWITLGWALLAAALAWLYTRVPHKGLLAWSAGLYAAVFVRLVFNPAVLSYHPRGGMVVLNWYLYAYLVPATSFFLGARFLKGRDDAPDFEPRLRLASILPGGGAVLLFLLLNIEIADAFSTGPAVTFDLFNGTLAQDLSYTIGWAVYAILMLVAGVAWRSRIARVAAILLLTVTVLKAFLHDLSSLNGLYRVASFVGLAACLAGVAVILQKYVLRRTGEPS